MQTRTLRKISAISLFAMMVFPLGIHSAPLWQGKGRIAISSDGNEHDHDDWAATPLSLALIAAKGLQGQLALYTYSDHVWGSNIDHSDGKVQARTSSVEGAKQFGFDTTRFVEAVSNPEKAYNALRDVINASSAENPLILVAAGPMQVPGEAIKRADTRKLPFVTIVSHSQWNDKHSDNPESDEPRHSGWTWSEIESYGRPHGLKTVHIVDQNGRDTRVDSGPDYDGLRADTAKFQWIRTSTARNNSAYKRGSWDWLYSRLQTCIKKPTSTSSIREFDPSDAGMFVFIFTGTERTNPSDAKSILENPIAVQSSSSSVSPSSSSGASSSSSITTGPTDIADLHAVQASNGAVQLNWTDTQGETGYRIRRKTEGASTYTNIADVTSGTTQYLDASAIPGVTYVYMVRPLVDGIAAAISNAVTITTTAQALAANLDIEPNPFRTDPLASFQLNQTAQTAVFKAYNNLGTMVLRINVPNPVQGEYLVLLNGASQLQSGSYVLKLWVDGKQAATQTIVHQ